MNTYDFHALNDKEFESLAIDLLSAEMGVRIERFKPGRDLGVDGRWFTSPGKENIVQCKHWIGSGFARLLAHLTTTERPKLDRLKCSRYLVATSVPLSRVNKRAIAEAMAPYVVTQSDVFGAEDLNDLLNRHPDVERGHYKLWLSSSNTLALLLNNAIVGRSRAELEQIRYEAPLYIMTADHRRAGEHLKEKRVLVLTGEPGIGKTTLARQLVLEYTADGFELAVLEESISEAENVFSDDAKQLFYFDDFLGRTFLEAIRAKQDSHVLGFMMRVARDPRKRFILTSRTNILNQGARLSDLYGDGQVVRNTYELRISSLTKLDRARILYNHIWHSKLDGEFIDALYVDKRYHQIIDHRNFNPRLVSFIVEAGKVNPLTPANYWAFVLDTFENPAGVWGHFFSAQLSQDDRDLTYFVVLNGGSINERDLRAAFFALPSAAPGNDGLRDTQFWTAVRHTSGSVVTRTLAERNKEVIYTLYNPSVADFVQSQLAESRLWAYYFRCVRTSVALLRVAQAEAQPFLNKAEYRTVLAALISDEAERAHPRDAYNLRLTCLAASAGVRHTEVSESISRWLSVPLSVDDDSFAQDCFTLIRSAVGLVDHNVLIQRSAELTDYIDSSDSHIGEPSMVADMLEILTLIGANDAFARIRAHAINEWTESIRERIAENNALSSYLDTDDIENAKAELKSFVAEQLSDMGIDLARMELDALCATVDLYDVIDDNIKIASRDDDSADRWGEGRHGSHSDESAIDDLFDRADK